MATRKNKSEREMQESDVAEVVGGGEDLGGMVRRDLLFDEAADGVAKELVLRREECARDHDLRGS